MGKIQEIIRRKPFFLVLVSAGFLFGLGFLKWNIHPTIGTVTFLLGGALGIYLLDVAEMFIGISPSPFRSVVFVAGLVIISLFIITSSDSMMANGLVLSLFLTVLFWQAREWEREKNLNNWYRMIAGTVPASIQRWIFWGSIVFFIAESLLFLQ